MPYDNTLSTYQQRILDDNQKTVALINQHNPWMKAHLEEHVDNYEGKTYREPERDYIIVMDSMILRHDHKSPQHLRFYPKDVRRAFTKTEIEEMPNKVSRKNIIDAPADTRARNALKRWVEWGAQVYVNEREEIQLAEHKRNAARDLFNAIEGDSKVEHPRYFYIRKPGATLEICKVTGVVELKLTNVSWGPQAIELFKNFPRPSGETPWRL